MKNAQILYILSSNVEKIELVLNKNISFIKNEKIVKKLLELLHDLSIMKNKMNNYIYKDYADNKVDRNKVMEKYEEYKNIMTFL